MGAPGDLQELARSYWMRIKPGDKFTLYDHQTYKIGRVKLYQKGYYL